MKAVDFDTWKAEYIPRIYDQSADMCEEDDHTDFCDCEYLYTVTLEDLADDEDDANAEAEQRLWTWREDGTIVSGIENRRADLLITEKPWSEPTKII
jgi:hypothetical protein